MTGVMYLLSMILAANSTSLEDILSSLTNVREYDAPYVAHWPQIVVTYNGDMLDGPFLETRVRKYILDICQELGIYDTHLDAFGWVKRDSCLLQGSQNLKAVTKYKWSYDSVSIDPEDMVRFAKTRPAYIVTYSVSDAVASYYLYTKYVHLFIRHLPQYS